MHIEIGITIAIIGSVIGILGYFAGRDKKIAYDAEWRGTVNAKLDVIVGIKNDVDTMQEKITAHEGRISAAENGIRAAHHRLDDIQKAK